MNAALELLEEYAPDAVKKVADGIAAALQHEFPTDLIEEYVWRMVGKHMPDDLGDEVEQELRLDGTAFRRVMGVRSDRRYDGPERRRASQSEAA